LHAKKRELDSPAYKKRRTCIAGVLEMRLSGGEEGLEEDDLIIKERRECRIRRRGERKSVLGGKARKTVIPDA